MLIALNGFFCFVKIPILAFSVVGISLLFLIGFSSELTGFNIILSLMLIVFMIGSAVQNYNDYKK
jgi:hypothetical protein